MGGSIAIIYSLRTNASKQNNGVLADLEPHAQSANDFSTSNEKLELQIVDTGKLDEDSLLVEAMS